MLFYCTFTMMQRNETSTETMSWIEKEAFLSFRTHHLKVLHCAPIRSYTLYLLDTGLWELRLCDKLFMEEMDSAHTFM